MIRTATPQDAQAVVELTVAAELFSVEESALVSRMLDEHFGPRAGDGQVCVVDDVDGRLVGVAHYAPRPASDRTWELVMIGVDRARHRRGHGAALLRHVEDDLRARAQRLLIVETSALPAFDRARAFYRACGYAEEGRIRDYYEAGDDMVVFRKAITPQQPATRAGSGDGAPRPARAGDLECLLALAEAFHLEDGFPTSASGLRRNLDVLLGSPAARVAVADVDGTPVGFAITTTTFGLEDGLIAELQDLYVDPGCRRRGIAERLIDDGAAWARHLGAAHLEIVIAPNGQDVSHLHAYYEARGFADEGRRLRSRSLG